MTNSPSSAVQAARRALGQRLKEMRQRTGMTARSLADRAGWSESKTSRLENGKTSPSDADLRAYAELCGAPEVYADLLASAHGIEGMYVEWRRLQRDGMRHAQQAHVPLYERTRRFRIYEPGVIPGILQTKDYARAIMRTISAFRRLPDDVEAALEVRMQRQRVVRDAGRCFGIILEEAALRARFGSREVMTEQLEHLLSIASLPHVSFGVVPFAADRRMWPLEGFWLFDNEQVIIELATAQIAVKQPSEIKTYERMFSALASIACYGKHARTLVADAVQALR
ncbi:helix-turn-helix transcriptional regulator [Streptomyces sp. RS10V-4]|uniref:helix-turn-helix domain-containing protein n=1 Tax=Streptomyces rhizoryzae TaxID=2932493 RepID=UPI0020062306|nr:helix-turn-helix transcriptional regulator [Streptomyces rhizoryzae]MCK7626259.1 helix-turn-helix transcriptional regulator [Streptomyces rhizoryzae]